MVRGAERTSAITIRVIGGKGDDVLTDSSRASNVHFYDGEGRNRFTTADHTRVDTREWDAPPTPAASRYPGDWAPHPFAGLAFGNDTELLGDEQSLVRMNRLSFEPSFVHRFGRWRTSELDSAATAGAQAGPQVLAPRRGLLALGPVVRHTRLEQGHSALGFDADWQLGAAARFELWHWVVQPSPSAASASSLTPPATRAELASRARMPPQEPSWAATFPSSPVVHISPSGRALCGPLATCPEFDAAAIGGRNTVRGFAARRWAGDAATYGSAELRVPVGRMPWFYPAPMGVFALVDAGRVFVNGGSPGGWHTGLGGGAGLVFADHTVSLAYARGERDALYAWLGLPF